MAGMRLIWGSCQQPSGADNFASMIAAFNPDLFIHQGDWVYTVQPRSWTGADAVTLTKTATAADYLTHYRNKAQVPGWMDFFTWKTASGIPAYFMPDDHEWIGNDWDHTIGASNNSFVPVPTHTTLAEVAASHWESVQAQNTFIAERWDNKINTDGVSPELPPEIATMGSPPSTAQYPVRYFRQRFNDAGQEDDAGTFVEVFVLDPIMYRGPTRATWTPAPAAATDTTLLGTNQKAWLLARLAASTATWKIISCNKQTFKNGGISASNPDTFHEYPTERDAIISYIKTNNIDNVIWLAGDRHTPTIIDDETGHICFVSGSLSVTMSNQNIPNMTLSNNNIWWGFEQQFGMLEFTETKAIVSFRGTRRYGGALFVGEIVAGTNRLTFPRPKLSL